MTHFDTPLLSAHSVTTLDTVHHMSAERLLTALPSDYVDLIVTSPPYDNLRTYKGFAWNFEYIARQSYRVLKPGGVLVWIVGDATVDGSETLSSFEQALYFKKQVGFLAHDTMIWQKLGTEPPHKLIRYANVFEYMFVFSRGIPKTTNIPTFPRTMKKRKRGRRNPDGSMRYDISGNGGAAYPNVWTIGAGVANQDDYTNHPAVFPGELATRHIIAWSNPGDIVLDYFGGSGTTAKMARKNGRRYITCDISKEYCDLMERRLGQPWTPMFSQMLETA